MSSDPETQKKDLLLDELDEKFAAFQAFRKSDTAAADEILGGLGAQDDVDKRIVLELSSPAPLGHPDLHLNRDDQDLCRRILHAQVPAHRVGFVRSRSVNAAVGAVEGEDASGSGRGRLSGRIVDEDLHLAPVGRGRRVRGRTAPRLC